MKKALPYIYYFLPVLILTFGGIFNSIYLAVAHYKNYTNLAYSSFCALSKAINCDTVAQSPYSIFMGLPLAIWGLFGYCIFLILLITVRKQSPENTSIWRILLLLSFLFSCFSIYLGYISATVIHSYCVMCLLSYTVNFSLFFYCLVIRSRFNKQILNLSIRDSIFLLKSKPYSYILLIIIFICLLSIKSFLPHYWDYNSNPLNTKILHGISDDGHPWIGAEDPQLTIEEFSDYECFQCYKMHFFLRRLVEQYPDKLRLIHHNFPLDNSVNPIIVPEPYHVGSGKLALLAIYASTQGKFWEANDAIYTLARKKEPFNTKILAQKTDLPAKNLATALYNPKINNVLTKDVWQGMKLRITSTPVFVIKNKVYQGSIPAEILETIIR